MPDGYVFYGVSRHTIDLIETTLFCQACDAEFIFLHPYQYQCDTGAIQLMYELHCHHHHKENHDAKDQAAEA